MALRIGINALYLIPGGVGGTEIYARQLLGALARIDSANRYFVVTNRETRDLAPAAPNVEWLPQPLRATNRPARILWEQTALPALAARRGLDVLLNPGFTAPVAAGCPQVTVFHDLQHKRHPEYFRWFDLPFWNLLLYASARRSASLIAVSEATRLDLLRYYGRDATVIEHGVEPAVFEIARRRKPRPMVLCVSTLHPHKGIETLLDGFAQFRAGHPEFRLVLAGMRGFAADSVEARVRDLQLGECVELTGWVPRERLYDLYGEAAVMVYPSTFEGFGMPVAEALAAGVPVACSDIEPLRSVAGGAALLFPPGDTAAIAEVLQRVVESDTLRAQLSQAGPRRAAGFTWESAASKTLAVLESTAAGRRPR
jgi:glycosyltransferase involved in cell wall biosynthesis